MNSLKLGSGLVIKLAFLLLTLLFFPSDSFASKDSPSITTIINQVRGNECCDVGRVDSLNQQIQTLNEYGLKATFTIRYDALKNKMFTDLLAGEDNHEKGLLLEITPLLASESGVHYLGDLDSWHEAQNVFLIGYIQEDRRKLIDTAINKFSEAFGYYPKTTGSWMIDSWSIKYLREKYGVLVHHITREQFNTDSYSLYGGPPHYPYFVKNWALIPSDSSSSSGLMIIRQTISDPVRNYGDTTNSFTSQPNDYQLTNKGFDYFKHLFEQAHEQELNPYTFANLGLENSMSQEHQNEYSKQLSYLSEWADGESKMVLTSSETYTRIVNSDADGLRVYAGSDWGNSASKSWWITSNNYRARLRLDENKLYISDLRVYSDKFDDPYFDKPASRLGWWIAPFVLDGSRFQQNGLLYKKDELLNDQIRPWWYKNTSPTQIIITNTNKGFSVVKQNGELTFSVNEENVAVFKPDSFSLKKDYMPSFSSDSTSDFIDNLSVSIDGSAYGFKIEEKDNFKVFRPYVSEGIDISDLRVSFPKFLFPELKEGAISEEHSHIYVNNQFARAGRNPIRIVFYPKNDDGLPTILKSPPIVSVSDDQTKIVINPSNGIDGSYFIDVFSNDPTKVLMKISAEGFEGDNTAYFAPNCMSNINTCLKTPKYLIWYLREKVDSLIN